MVASLSPSSFCQPTFPAWRGFFSIFTPTFTLNNIISGLEPLAVFSIACNVMQTIAFTREAITTFNHIRENGTVDSQLQKDVHTVLKMSQDLSSSLQNTHNEDAELIKTANDCDAAAQKLAGVLGKLVLQDQKGIRKPIKTFVLSVKKLWKNSEIVRLEKELNRIHQNMTSSVINRTWYVKYSKVVIQVRLYVPILTDIDILTVPRSTL